MKHLRCKTEGNGELGGGLKQWDDMIRCIFRSEVRDCKEGREL